MAHLLLRQPGKQAISFSLDGLSQVRLGRHESNELVLEDEQASRRHAVLMPHAAGWEVRDLESRHGTAVNGERIQQRNLSDGDRIQIGHALIDFSMAMVSEIVHAQSTSLGPPKTDAKLGKRLRLLYDVSAAIGAQDDTDALIGQFLSAIRSLFDCERVLLVLGNPERPEARRYANTRAGQDRAEDIVLSRSVLEATQKRREAVIVRDAPAEMTSKTMVRERIRSAMAVPVGLHTRTTGLLYVDDRQYENRFDEEDLNFLTAFSHLLSVALDNAERFQRIEEAACLSNQDFASELIGQSPAMNQLKSQIAKFGAAGHTHVLIRGESGSGKELVARALHAASPRQTKPFVTLNCAAIPETMLEAELFGHEKGAFTGALKATRGKFVLADKGTLFLDEIGDLALPAQAKLLRAIQEGEVQPLGAERSVKVDVRVVSATHKDLWAEVMAKRFREDLYYRLNVVEILVPPLRERPGDVALLAEVLLRKSAAAMGKPLLGFTKAAIAALEKHRYPGNVRELRNEVERAAINAEDAYVDACDLSPRLGASVSKPGELRGQSLAERFAMLEPMEKQLVEEALKDAKGNISEAGRLLGISRQMIRRRVERFGFEAKED